MNDVLKDALTQERDSILSKMAGYDDLKKRLDAINTLLNPELAPEINDSPVGEYEKFWTWEQKCFYVINQMGEAYAETLAGELVKLEPDITIDYARKKAALCLSKLHRAGKIAVLSKSGNRFKYGAKKDISIDDLL